MSGKEPKILDREGIVKFGFEMAEDREDVITPINISEVGDLEELGNEITKLRKNDGKHGVVFVVKPEDDEVGSEINLNIFCLFESELY